jgi:hypothetical protein
MPQEMNSRGATWLFRASATMCFVLCAMLAVLWLRSYKTLDIVRVRIPTGHTLACETKHGRAGVMLLLAGPRSWRFSIPIAIAGGVAILLWIQLRFSLRLLLMATCGIAVLLWLTVSTNR